MKTVQAARIPRDDKAVSDLITNNGSEAETRSKITDFTKQVSGTFTKYFNDGKQTLSSFAEKAETQFKNIGKASQEQIKKASQSVSRAVENVRQSITGSKKTPEAPKIENPIASLGN